MKKAPIFPYIAQILVLSVLLFLGIQGWNYFTTESVQEEVQQENTNSEVFSSAYSSNFWITGVALSTRVGTNFRENTGIVGSDTIAYKEITIVWETSAEKKDIRANMITQNMIIIREYLNLSRTNVKDILSSSNNRRTTLEGFISQLELRYKNSALSIKSLEQQRLLLLWELTKIDSAIEATKLSMQKNFSESRPNTTLDNVDTYLELRSRYAESFTDIVFISQFLKQHEFLNNYNKGILDTLINNKEALINESYVVIPDSGDGYLRPLELLFEEAEIKALRNSSE